MSWTYEVLTKDTFLKNPDPYSEQHDFIKDDSVPHA